MHDKDWVSGLAFDIRHSRSNYWETSALGGRAVCRRRAIISFSQASSRSSVCYRSITLARCGIVFTDWHSQQIHDIMFVLPQNDMQRAIARSFPFAAPIPVAMESFPHDP